jgi:hypothetical protein
VAPVIFNSYWEFNVMAAVAWVVLAIVFARDKRSFFFTGDRWHFYLLIWFGLYFAVRVAILAASAVWVLPDVLLLLPVAAAAALCLTLLGGYLLRKRRFPDWKYWPRVLVGLVVILAEGFMVMQIRTTNALSLAADRNFFGALRVQLQPPHDDRPGVLHLTHGKITHGYQYLDDELRRVPVAYYGEPSGIWAAVTLHPRRQERPGRDVRPLRIGVLGLGTGTMAAFAKPGDRIRFYEINPMVAALSAGEGAIFSYLAESEGKCDVVLGDARLSLERELQRGEAQRYDVLVVDVFSSDSIPVHLLTREAFEVYARHLRDDDSIIAVNISNRFLDFRDLVATTAEDLGYTPLLVVLEEDTLRASPSIWMLLTRSTAFMENSEVQRRSIRWRPRHPRRWTDSFSNLFHLLR